MVDRLPIGFGRKMIVMCWKTVKVVNVKTLVILQEKINYGIPQYCSEVKFTSPMFKKRKNIGEVLRMGIGRQYNKIRYIPAMY